MPNYCNNIVTLKHNAKEKIDEAINAFKEDTFCSHFIPIPNDLKLDGRDYDFRVESWGTKWDCGEGVGGCYDKITDNEVRFTFTSAWAPPIGLYQVLFKNGYDVNAMYFEPGMGFAGDWDNGMDEFYDDARDAPNYLKEAMNVMDNYDEENNE